jgi:hypothetical protein
MPARLLRVPEASGLMRDAMGDAWIPSQAAGGVLTVWLPPGEHLQGEGAITVWPAESRFGRLTILAGPARGATPDRAATELIAGEMNAGEVSIEADDPADRGGLPARRIRYRSQYTPPHVTVEAGAAGPSTPGGAPVGRLNDLIFVLAADTLIRVGYSVLDAAPNVWRDRLAEILQRIRIGDER